MSDYSRPPTLVLASGSPRRKELLGRLDIAFSIDPADVVERPPVSGEDPAAYALALAHHKASAGARRHPHAVVLGADTVVTICGLILGKPSDEQHALEMLRRLRGRGHHVITAVAVCSGLDCTSDAVTSGVWMKRATDDELRAYVATGEPMDKAGAYALQGLGGQLVERISGCYNNVVGLPLCLTSNLIREWSIDVPFLESKDPHLPLSSPHGVPS